MPEGPLIVIARENLEQLTGKKKLSVSEDAKIDKNRLLNHSILEIKI